MKIEIKQTKDFRELAELNEAVQNWHHANYPDDFKPFENHEVERAFEKMIRSENFIAFIAKHKDKAIGYLLAYVKKRPDSAFQYEKTILYIDQVAVIEEYQKNGIGEKLIKEAYHLADRMQIQEIQLDFWQGNELAERFFSKNGFGFFNYKMKRQL
ncbi:MAG: GNAT family N-acetyltransferase [Flavobacteriales bacterium]|nr:GNAT family N-acetyltransferase [Flavobacteriales bacterium]